VSVQAIGSPGEQYWCKTKVIVNIKGVNAKGF